MRTSKTIIYFITASVLPVGLALAEFDLEQLTPKLPKFPSLQFLPMLGNILSMGQNFVGSMRNKRNENPAIHYTTPDIIKHFGYPVESHKVTTEDGYILTIHRIPHGKNEYFQTNSKSKTTVQSRPRPAVFLNHGLCSSSFEWFFNKPENLIALRLADSGYDVWLSNARGNPYSREHIKMTTSDRDFWEFSMNEMGLYDVPAGIDYILKTTNQTQLTYIGFSMGTSQFFIMCSKRPDYNKKIRIMIALAPVVYINNMRALIRQIAYFDNLNIFLGEPIMHGEFMPQWLLNIYTYLEGLFCSNLLHVDVLCTKNVMYDMWDPEQSQPSQMPLFYSHTPAPTSTRTLSHLSQIIVAGSFQEYDFGLMKNILIYEDAQPRKYSLKRTTAPVALFYGPSDSLVNPSDVERVVAELPNVIFRHAVNSPKWNHYDFHLAKNVNEKVNDKILDLMDGFY